MNNDLARAISLLKENNYTCVLCKGETVYTTTQRGVLPLVEWLEAGLALQGFSAADKVVGKAAAFLYALAGIKEVYAQVISKSAWDTLTRYGIEVSCETMVEKIINRTGTGPCPMEYAVRHIDGSPKQALAAVKETLQALRSPAKEKQEEQQTVPSAQPAG